MSDYGKLLGAMHGRWAVVLISVLMGVSIAALWSFTQPVTYTSTARVFMATPNWNDMIGSGGTSGGDSALAAAMGSGDVSSSYGNQFTQQRMPTYLAVLSTPPVLGPVAKQFGVSESDLAARVTARLVPETVMLDITVSADSASGAADTANAVVAQYGDVVKNLETPSYSAASPVQPVVVTPALPPDTASAPNVPLYITVGAAIGLLVGIGAAVAISGRRRDDSNIAGRSRHSIHVATDPDVPARDREGDELDSLRSSMVLAPSESRS